MAREVFSYLTYGAVGKTVERMVEQFVLDGEEIWFRVLWGTITYGIMGQFDLGYERAIRLGGLWDNLA